MRDNDSQIPAQRIERAIVLIRGQRVLLDSDLAELYGVTTSRLNEQVKRNRDRFPEDFMFRLASQEYKGLDVAICDIKSAVGRAPKAATGVHGAWCSHGRKCTQQSYRSCRKY